MQGAEADNCLSKLPGFILFLLNLRPALDDLSCDQIHAPAGVSGVTHGDDGTSVSDKIDQKTKKVANTRFFLRIFSPAHFDHWKLK